MMDDKNKKLEEFFNRSLEDFNDGPSEQVWAGLADRLEEDMTFFQRWRNQVVRWLPVLLLLLGFGAYYLFTENKLNELQGEVLSMQIQNDALNNNLLACEKTGNEYENSIEEGKLTKNKTENFNSNPFNQSKKAIGIESKGSRKNQNSVARNYQPSNTNQKQPITRILERNNFAYQPGIFPNNSELGIRTAILDNAEKENSKTSAVNQKRFVALDKLSRHRSRIAPQYLAGNGNLGVSFIYIPPNDQLQTYTTTRYRIGYNSRTVSTIMGGIGNRFNFGNANGIRQEYNLKNKWWLTNQISYVRQSYTFRNKGNLIPFSELQRFPGAESLNDVITKIKVKSKYIDLALGLKWEAWRGRNGTSYFVNPSVVWQLYLPQDFAYTLTDGSNIDQKEKRYFGYFGSGNLQVGMERRFSKRFIWQIGLWAERSFTPLGLEDQPITLAGLSTSILFGKVLKASR